jgi:hypothetical protein
VRGREQDRDHVVVAGIAVEDRGNCGLGTIHR